MDCLTLDGDLKTHQAENPYFSIFALEAHSSTTATTTNVHANNSMHSMVVDEPSRIQSITDGVSADADINNFLSRKVKIATYTWAVGADFAHNFDPWNLFLANPAVTNKLQNYYLVKGDLKVTFYVNGTPFHAGMLLASYQYLNGGAVSVTIGGDTQLVTRSQRPHLNLNVSTCKSGCLCIPFFVPQNYLSLTSAHVSAANIGTMNIDSYASLVQINAGTDSVTITVFAELTNAVLTAPTDNAVSLSGDCHLSFEMFDLEAHSGDEYTTEGVISGPASTVAAIAGRLVEAPVIGPLALATQMGANAIAGFARFFGYSKPVVLEDIKPMRNTPVSHLALTEGGDMSQKLTVTGKQEITIDPSTVNLPPEDELALSFLTRKESYVTQFSWDVTDAVASTLFACDIDPMVERRSVVTGGHIIIPTSLSFASRAYEGWSGTLNYRFQVIASQYHRGRIAIIYDPTGPISTDPYNTTFNTIIDLSEGRDFTVSFKWQQDMPYLFCNKANAHTFYTQTAPETEVAARANANGIFFVSVVNELVVPDGTTGIKILVSISAGDDFELVNPTHEGMEVFPYAPIAQSGNDGASFSMFDLEAHSAVEETPDEENAPEGEINMVDVTTGVQIHEDEKPKIFYGERNTSIRQLLKRSCNWRSIVTQMTVGTDMARCQFLFKAMPAVGGYDTAGADTTAAASKYWYVNNVNINYFKGAYAGWRGSIRWKFLPNGDNSQSMTVHRAESATQRAAVSNGRTINVTEYIPATTSYTEYAYAGTVFNKESNGGSARTQNRSMDSLEVEIPYALPLRFSLVRGAYMPVSTNTLANSYPGGNAFLLTTSTSHGTETMAAFDTYVSAGEDFTLFGFVGAPVVYSATNPVP